MEAKKPIDRDALCQRWIHSHEEDTDQEMVFRPANFAFPPARGRTGFELRDDKTCAYVGIGPTDRPKESDGNWEFNDDAFPHIWIDCEGSTQVLAIISIEKDRLVINKQE